MRIIAIMFTYMRIVAGGVCLLLFYIALRTGSAETLGLVTACCSLWFTYNYWMFEKRIRHAQEKIYGIKIPRLPNYILYLSLPQDAYELVRQDLGEEYAFFAGKFGIHQAGWWLWSQVVRLVPKFFQLRLRHSEPKAFLRAVR